MPVTAEALLALGLIAVYLLDSMHFLRIGEAVVVTGGARLSRLSFGSGFEFGGRRPFLTAQREKGADDVSSGLFL